MIEDLASKLALVVIVGASDRRSPVETAAAALRGGATTIQLRRKHAHTRELLDIGPELRALTRDCGGLLIVNDRVDVAMAIEADGAHLGDDDLPLATARRIVPAGFVLGRSVDDAAQAVRAASEGADYVGLGPIFPTRSKRDTGPVVGLAGITAVRAKIDIPIVAIGGIDAANAGGVVEAGANGVAVIAAVEEAEDPEQAARQLARAVGAGGD